MKPVKSLLVLFLFIVCYDLSGQNLIGYKDKEIRQYMKDKQKNMHFESLIFNNTFKYLKYADRNGTQTVLFFLTADSVCKSVRLVCDKDLEADKIRELDGLYRKTGTNTWSETSNNKQYIFELKEEEWTFNLTIKLIE